MTMKSTEMVDMTGSFTTAEHRKFFAEFCRWELASGGPDPQLAMVHEMSKGQPEEEHLWRALCWIAVYNVPYGEVLWMNWDSVSAYNRPTELSDWLVKEFASKRITTRIERRSTRRADWMELYLLGALRFVRGTWPELKERVARAPSPEAGYELTWNEVLRLPQVGRYAAIKLIEYLRRYLDLAIVTPDIRPKDAWSPRHTLGYIFPDRGLGNKSNTDLALKMARGSCVDAIQLLKDEYDVSIDMFQLQVLLCEYRESWESRKQYPGRSLDSELGYAGKAELEWGHSSDIWRARKELFPHRHLGELRGWAGTRKEVGQCLNNHSYTWTDLLYDYTRTTNMSRPYFWE
jgi:hypothetical protein